MLFALWGVFITLGLGVNELRKKGTDLKRRSNTIDGITYIDSSSKMRLLSNNHPCIEIWNHGDKEIIDCLTMKVMWSTKNNRINNNINVWREDAIKKGRSTFRCDVHNDDIHYYEIDEKIHGHIYEDFETGKKYIIKQSRNDFCYFFVDIETKKAIRYTDYTIQKINKMLSEEKENFERLKKDTTCINNYYESRVNHWLNIKNGSKLDEWNNQDEYLKRLNGKEEKVGQKMEEEFNNK